MELFLRVLGGLAALAHLPVLAALGVFRDGMIGPDFEPGPAKMKSLAASATL